MTTAPARQRFHRWVLPLAWLVPALYVAFQRSDKVSALAFESITGHWLRRWFDVSGSHAYLAAPLAAGIIECAALGFLMDGLFIRRWIYAFATPIVVLALWGSIPPAGNAAIFCTLICWGVYAVGMFSVAGGLVLKIVRRNRSKRQER